MSSDCVFCQILSGQRPSDPVYEDELVYAFRDVNPQAPTHILIVPKKHIARLVDLVADDIPLMGRMVYAAKLIAEQEGIGAGFRLVINNGALGGQSVFHIHLHLIGGRPMRWPPG